MARPIQVKPADSESRGGSSNLPVAVASAASGLRLRPAPSAPPEFRHPTSFLFPHGCPRTAELGRGERCGQSCWDTLYKYELGKAQHCRSLSLCLSWLSIETGSRPPLYCTPVFSLFLPDAPSPRLYFLALSSPSDGQRGGLSKGPGAARVRAEGPRV